MAAVIATPFKLQTKAQLSLEVRGSLWCLDIVRRAYPGKRFELHVVGEEIGEQLWPFKEKELRGVRLSVASHHSGYLVGRASVFVITKHDEHMVSYWDYNRVVYHIGSSFTTSSEAEEHAHFLVRQNGCQMWAQRKVLSEYSISQKRKVPL